MKYEVGDEVELGNPGYKRKGVVVKATPPQPTYEVKCEDGHTFHREENQLSLLKRRCSHWRTAVVVYAKSQGNVDKYVTFDFCPNCGVPLTDSEGK